MSTLIVGIDVSQAHNDVCAMNERGEVVERPQRFANDRSGRSELETWLSEVLATDDYDALQIGCISSLRQSQAARRQRRSKS